MLAKCYLWLISGTTPLLSNREHHQLVHRHWPGPRNRAIKAVLPPKQTHPHPLAGVGVAGIAIRPDDLLPRTTARTKNIGALNQQKFNSKMRH